MRLFTLKNAHILTVLSIAVAGFPSQPVFGFTLLDANQARQDVSGAILSDLERWKTFVPTSETLKEYISHYQNPNVLMFNYSSFSAKIKILDHLPAGSKVKILTFVFDYGVTTRKLAAHMCRAALRGVEVRFMADSKSGSIPGTPNLFEHADTEEIYQYLANCGVKVRIFNHIKQFNVSGGKAVPRKRDFTKLAIRSLTALITSDSEALAKHPLNRLNHRKLFWFENASSPTKEACFLLGGRNLGDHYQAWDPTGDSFLDGDILLCRHFLEDIKKNAPNDRSDQVIQEASDSFDWLWGDPLPGGIPNPHKDIYYEVTPNPNFTFHHIWFENEAEVKGVQFARSNKEWDRVLPNRLLPSDNPAFSTEPEVKEKGRIPVAVPIDKKPFEPIIKPVINDQLLNAYNWHVITSVWDPKRDRVRKALYEAIEREQADIFIETAYAELDEQFTNLIESALKRGVHVTVVTNSFFTLDGPSKMIRLSEADNVNRLIRLYGPVDAQGKRISVLDRYKYPKLRERAAFWYYATTLHAGHMIHFKGAGFRCQKAIDNSGQPYYFKTFLLGSHNFHPRSGLSDQEHDLWWNEPMGRTCVSKFGEEHFTAKQIAQVKHRYHLNDDGSFKEIKEEHMDIIDMRMKFYENINEHSYAKFGKDLLMPYVALHDEFDHIIGTDMPLKNITDDKQWQASFLRRIIYQDQDDIPQLRGSAEFILNMLGPLWPLAEKFL